MHITFKKLATVTLAASIILLFLANTVYAHTITVPANTYFGFGTGSYINFNSPMTFDNIYRENGFWYFNGYGFQVKNANVTITKFYADYMPSELTFEAKMPKGKVGETILTGLGRIPIAVYIDGSLHYPKSTKADYDACQGNCWYYDSTNDLIYVKTAGSTVQIIWSGYTPSPPTETPPTAPPITPTPQLYDVKITDAPFLVLYPFQPSFTVKVTIVNPTSLTADALLHWQLLNSQNQTVIQGTQVIMVPAYTNTTTTINIPTPITLTETYTLTIQTTQPLQSLKATQTIQVTSIPALLIFFAIILATTLYIKRRR